MKRIIFAFVLLISIWSTGAIAEDTVEARVVNVVNGDVLVVSIDHIATIVKLYGIDCPERGEQGWKQVREYTRKLVLHQKVCIQKEGPPQAGQINAVVYVGDQCLNETLVDAGYARVAHTE